MNTSQLDLVEARLADIAKQVADLERERSDLEITARTLKRLLAVAGSKAILHAVRRNGNGHQLSQKEMLVGTLRAEKDVWIGSARDLQRRIKILHGADIPMTSIYPYLTELKAEGTVVRSEKGAIALAERLQRKEAAE